MAQITSLDYMKLVWSKNNSWKCQEVIVPRKHSNCGESADEQDISEYHVIIKQLDSDSSSLTQILSLVNHD